MDSKGAYDTVTNHAYTKHSKHLEIHHDFMRERYQRAEVDYILVPGAYNPADVFTKPLGRIKFELFRDVLGMAELPALSR